jgi:2-dehydro-3-deoxyphosphogluconate aldolase / (4S)-4-hydroxy-2-oxoglutarate aldolase
MTKAEIVRYIKGVGVIPVVRAPSGAEAIELAQAVSAGGLPILEVTLTVPNALLVIERLILAFGTDTLVGAGSVLDAKTARDCIAAGARFIVSPVLDLETIACCREQGIAVIPGALTPTEVVTAWNAGADLVKVFPASAMGGASYIRSLKAPMPHLELVPTGGVTRDNVASYIQAGAAAVGAGADLVDREALRAGRSDLITTAARAYVEAVRTARRDAGSQFHDATMA